MSASFEPLDIVDARQILTGFVARAEASPPVRSFAELEGIVSPDVAPAMASLILIEGEPQNRPRSLELAVMTVQNSRRKVVGKVTTDIDGSGEPLAVDLVGYNRFVGFRRSESESVTLGVAGDLQGRAIAKTSVGNRIYMPQTASDEYINGWGNQGPKRLYLEGGRTETALGVASMARSRAEEVLNGFLEVTAKLTGELVNGLK